MRPGHWLLVRVGGLYFFECFDTVGRVPEELITHCTGCQKSKQNFTEMFVKVPRFVCEDCHTSVTAGYSSALHHLLIAM